MKERGKKSEVKTSTTKDDINEKVFSKKKKKKKKRKREKKERTEAYLFLFWAMAFGLCIAKRQLSAGGELLQCY